MLVYTILRHIGDKIIPMRSFDSIEKAKDFAELQMKYLDKEYFYSIAMWETSRTLMIPCEDKRLRLVK
jgi:hypothetical protein